MFANTTITPNLKKLILETWHCVHCTAYILGSNDELFAMILICTLLEIKVTAKLINVKCYVNEGGRQRVHL